MCVAFGRAHGAEDPRRLLPRAGGQRFSSSLTVGARPKIPVAMYLGHQADDPWLLRRGRDPGDSRRRSQWARGTGPKIPVRQGADITFLSLFYKKLLIFAGRHNVPYNFL